MTIPKSTASILFVADVIGKPGYDILAAYLPSLKKKYAVDLCIVNGENGEKGKGTTENLVKKYRTLGVDVITGGNHSWTFASFRRYLDQSNWVLRPANYPDEAPGKGAAVFQSASGLAIGVLNLQGRAFMYPIDCPFKRGMEEIDRLLTQTKIIIVDVHAEATAEKMALGWHFDGKASAVIGTHTHVQTADERILPKGTAYISDAGMTGPNDSVIGLEVDVAIKRFISGIPEFYQMATSNNRLNGVVITVDGATGRAQNIERINLP
ncbi:TIGR00282 family metallophosphoesterase [candidate division KSB1 bacterium]|nr:TIGR00282 family metallophosphoesterase [candidate division KSB1 bacterium]